MATKYQTSQQDEQSDLENPSSNGNIKQSSKVQTSNESESNEVGEVKGTTDLEFSPTSSEASESDESNDNHQTMSSPNVSQGSNNGESQSDETGESEEAADTETEYEAVEGWEESDPQEAKDENETLIEASFADSDSSQGGQEFFGAIAGLLAPMIPTLIKAVAPSVIKGGSKLFGGLIAKGAKRLSPNAQNLINRLKALGLNVPSNILAKLESASEDEYSGDEAVEVDEAALEALKQQLEALEVVIGIDDRVRITTTTNVPWKRICHLKITTTTGKSYLGTGFFIGPRTILTAAHCVYIHSQGGWAKNIVVTPGRNGTETPPKSFTATKFRSVKGWVVNKNRIFDYAAIQLEKSDVVSKEIGTFGFGHYPNPFLVNKRLNSAGYPGDKPSGTMWFNGRKGKSFTDRTITYDIDTAGGQSGSPVWIKGLDGKRTVVGIHTNGATTGNSATRITKEVFDNLKKWRNEGGNTL